MVNRLLAVLRVAGQTAFLFGLLAWFYGVLIQITHPEWLPLGLSHLVPWIRVDTFTIAAFLVAGLGFILWRLTREWSIR